MGDLKNAATNAVVVSEGIPSKVGTRGGPRGPRAPKPVNTRAIQAAVNRAEINGPLASLGALYAALTADEMFNVNTDDVATITKRLKAGIEAGVTIQTVAAPKGRAADSDRATNDGITEAEADEIRVSYAHFANSRSLEILLAKAMAGKKRALRLIGGIESLMNEPEPEVPAENAETTEPVPA